jgi:diacylglycerol kinase family enzyme
VAADAKEAIGEVKGTFADERAELASNHAVALEMVKLKLGKMTAGLEGSEAEARAKELGAMIDAEIAGKTSEIDTRARGAHLDSLTTQAGVMTNAAQMREGRAARAGALTNRRYKPLGAAGYVAAVVQSTLELATDAHPFSTDRAPRDGRPAILLSFSNSRATGGGMQMAPRAETDDGELDIIRIGPMSRGDFLGRFPSIFSGTHVDTEGVEQTRARSVDFDLGGRTVDCMVDGEVLPLALERIEVIPRAFDVVA